MNFLNFVIIYFSFFQLKKGAVFLKWDVGVGISILISISDGLCPCIFRRKMEKTRLVREKWIKGCLFPARVDISEFDVVFCKITFPYS